MIESDVWCHLIEKVKVFDLDGSEDGGENACDALMGTVECARYHFQEEGQNEVLALVPSGQRGRIDQIIQSLEQIVVMVINHDASHENNRQPKVNLTDGLNNRIRLVIPLTKKLSLAAIAKLVDIGYLGLIVDFGLDALQEDSDNGNETLQVS